MLVRYHISKILPLESILRQLNPLHILTLHVFNIHLLKSSMVKPRK
jgi:hypothetical protein